MRALKLGIKSDRMGQTGRVFLVGSGTGTIAHLTVQAQQLLATAEVLLYDALAEGELLRLVPATCLKLEVGKRGGQPSLPQAEINRLMVEHCQQGQRVVRLKSGDPFIFGRSQAEIQALQAANCDFEVVPGLSSALVAPLLVGIPLTDPAFSRCFAVLSAHDPAAIDWQTIARLETLVILMGGQALPEIVQRLQQAGKSAQTPIAIVRWAGRPEQQFWEGTLADILRKTANKLLSPCVILIGEVVQLRHHLQPTFAIAELTVTTTSDPRPALNATAFAGKTILVTRSATQSNQFSDRLQQIGAAVVEMPALEIVPPSSWVELDGAIARLRTFDWLILTSGNAVDYFFNRLATQLTGIGGLGGIKIAAIGEKTAQKLKERGMQPDFVPPDYIADSLAVHFPGRLAGAKVLFPRVETGGRDVLVKDMVAKGADVTEVAAYQSQCPETIAPAALAALQNRQVDVITFASAKTVKHFCQLLERSQPDNTWQSWLEAICIASIGPQTSKACEDLLGRVDAEAQEYTVDGLVTAIGQWLSREQLSG
jgi:uroporphyrinogen III methyltransferase/synthase